MWQFTKRAFFLRRNDKDMSALKNRNTIFNETLSFEVTPLARALLDVWFNFSINYEKIKKEKQYKEFALKRALNTLLESCTPEALATDRAILQKKDIYRDYFSPYVISFEDSSLTANIPYILFYAAEPLTAQAVYQKLVKFHEQNHQQKQKLPLTAKKFLSFCFEAIQSTPFKVNFYDRLVLIFVSHLSYFRDEIEINKPVMIIKRLNLKRRDRASVERSTNVLRKAYVWSPNFFINVTPLGFNTYFIDNDFKTLNIDWNSVSMENLSIIEVYKKVHRHDNLFTSELDTSESKGFGIYQIPIYWRINDQLLRYHIPQFKKLVISYNLSYIERGYNFNANFPIKLQDEHIIRPTNSFNFDLSPDWFFTENITKTGLQILRYFSDMTNATFPHYKLARIIGVSVPTLKKQLRFLVKNKVLYYFPNFMRIGMNNRYFLLLKSNNATRLEALVSSFYTAPRTVAYIGNNIAVLYLNLGKSQILGIKNQLISFNVAFKIIPAREPGVSYVFRRFPLYKFSHTRRKTDNLLMFYDPNHSEQILGLNNSI